MRKTYLFSVIPPARRVQFILGESFDGSGHESRPLFTEMQELVRDGDENEWKETARWVKFEENVEEGRNRWSKPHVPTLSLRTLVELRSLLTSGIIILDMEASNLDEIVSLVCDNWVNTALMPFALRGKLQEAFQLHHRHQHERSSRKRYANVRSNKSSGTLH